MRRKPLPLHTVLRAGIKPSSAQQAGINLQATQRARAITRAQVLSWLTLGARPEC